MEQHHHHTQHHSRILEDDQQLYDWGIERLDQYYLNGENPPGQSGEIPYNQSGGGHYEGSNYHGEGSVPSARVYNQTGDMGKAIGSCGSVSLKEGGELIRSLSNHLSNRNNILNSNNSNHNKQRPFLPQAVDMDINESLKVERKRARNRVAASKCRLRKLERISILDQQASQLRADNDELASLSTKLKAEIFALKEELNWHINNGCKIWYSDSNWSERKSNQSTDSASSSPSTSYESPVKQETSMYSPELSSS
eukprot:TRINITY_DN2007_c0_g1_i1.p1 TRINITY_DN2007_c0_g1~~TRINITY_DN2007_c0_g1_i1.p1  ORF type:complete len:253 (+),score=53.54 TRINITY_DN2007_c0_g1_i1:13-771(+)